MSLIEPGSDNAGVQFRDNLGREVRGKVCKTNLQNTRGGKRCQTVSRCFKSGGQLNPLEVMLPSSMVTHGLTFLNTSPGRIAYAKLQSPLHRNRECGKERSRISFELGCSFCDVTNMQSEKTSRR